MFVKMLTKRMDELKEDVNKAIENIKRNNQR